MGSARKFKCRCTKCMKELFYQACQDHSIRGLWENIEVVKACTDSVILRCCRCGHEYRSTAKAAFRMAKLSS